MRLPRYCLHLLRPGQKPYAPRNMIVRSVPQTPGPKVPRQRPSRLRRDRRGADHHPGPVPRRRRLSPACSPGAWGPGGRRRSPMRIIPGAIEGAECRPPVPAGASLRWRERVSGLVRAYMGATGTLWWPMVRRRSTVRFRKRAPGYERFLWTVRHLSHPRSTACTHLDNSPCHLDNSPWLLGAAGCRALEVPQSPEAHDCGGAENRAGQEQGEFKALEK